MAVVGRGKVKARPGKRLLEHDKNLGVRFVAGCDEAGRGCLAGPLVAAAVILDLEKLTGPEAAALGSLNDSKKLSIDVREKLYNVVLARARDISITSISAETIDRKGLHISNINAMRLSISNLKLPCEKVLVDGFKLEPVLLKSGVSVECQQIIKGDATSAAIAAAAIIAKVTRDRLMKELDELTSELWAFSAHMGYATELHSQRIQEHGITMYHRKSYNAAAYIGAKEVKLSLI